MAKDPSARGIYKRGKVYWLAQQRDHKRVFISLETESLSEAITRAARIRNAPELNSGGTMAAEVERFLAHKLREREFGRQTADNARGFLRRLVEHFAGLGPTQVTVAAAQRFYEVTRASGMAESSAQTYVAHARSFFRWCVDVAKTVRTNPFDAVEMPKIKPVARKEFCRPVLRDKLLAECPRDDLRFVLLCGFHAGLRRNEIVEARPEWFDLDHRLLNIRKLSEAEAKRRGLDPFETKDREERTIPLSAIFADFLKNWLVPDAAYCLAPENRRGSSRYRYDFRRYFEEYMALQGCEWVTAHTMRRTFASIQVSKGRSIYLVAKWLGDDIRTTERHYGHLIPAHNELEQGI